MSNFSTMDLTIFCLTVIALVAIVYQKEEIASKAISIIDKVVVTLSEPLKNLAQQHKNKKNKA